MLASGSNRDFVGDIHLSRSGNPQPTKGLLRRDFLIRFCQGAGAILIPKSLWGFALPESPGLASRVGLPAPPGFQLHPRYRNERPLDATLRLVEPGLDEFVTEKYAQIISGILARWSESLRKSPAGIEAFEAALAADFSGGSFQPAQSRAVRSDSWLEVHQNGFDAGESLDRESFLRRMKSSFGSFSRVLTAEFQITGIDSAIDNPSSSQGKLQTRIRYELVGTGPGFYREQRVGYWDLDWELSAGEFRVARWSTLGETHARSHAPVYWDATAASLGANASFAAQLQHGTDHWRTILDGATGIDIYGHNGVALADIDNDGFDDLYVCQPAGLPNRLYHNRGDGTFEDVTETSGLGILENTASALFADFNNDGLQDVIVVRTDGPLLFLNQGGGKFRLRSDAFHFANPPQGTFTGAAVADYDRDGWLDIYFCLYAYYQGTGQYKYPLPYHEAENGPPNFMMRNQRDGTFRDVTVESGLSRNNTRYSFCCAWGDFDADGWPDLYVVNDFGRKNLYRNNGDGTFTDVAVEARVEDVGAGMGVGWLDYDNDGRQDIYVANMWTAAGERISTQENFKRDSSPEVRALYQKHAMGDSLFRNQAAGFDDTTTSSGTGNGRWAWASDSFDFDHDGLPDLYIVNGMVSGRSAQDLNSFFWRQVVARSPDGATPSKTYEQGWNAINELIRADGSWSGYERNVCYANNRDGTFSDVSGAIGLDFIEDGRSFGLADLDHDGRLEIVLKSRNAPQVRILKNAVKDLPPSIALRLKGTKSNRDAIGAAVTIKSGAGRQTRMLQAGSGFLSQHSKDVFFGLGKAEGPIHASIRWPSGLVQEFQNLPINHRIWVEEGAEPTRLEAFQGTPLTPDSAAETQNQPELLPENVETWLLLPVSAPDFSLRDQAGIVHSLARMRGKPVLLNFWISQSAACLMDVKTFQTAGTRWGAQGLQLLVVNVGSAETPSTALPRTFLDQPPTMLSGSADVIAVYNILYHQLFDRHRDLSLPTSFLIDGRGNIVKVYQGAIVPEHVEHDFRNIPQTDAERLAVALPFPGKDSSLEFGRNYLSLGALFFQRGYLDEARASFEQASRDDPASAEALYGIGSVYLNQNQDIEARKIFERAVKMQASYPDTLPDSWNNLGVIATREGRVSDAVDCFQQALRTDPHHLLALDNLGNAYRLEKKWDEARSTLTRALELAPEDPEANYSLGMVFAQANDSSQAYEYLQRALKARPDYPEALNNLGVLYLRTGHRDDAVASFEKCIRVAPEFDQSYLNLARVYAIEGSRDKARETLLELLKQHPGHAQAKQLLEQLQE